MTTPSNEFTNLATAHEVVRRTTAAVRLGMDYLKIVSNVQQEVDNVAMSGVQCTPDASFRAALRAISSSIQPFNSWRTPQQIIAGFLQSDYCTRVQVLEHLESAERALWSMCEAAKADLVPGRKTGGAGLDENLAVGTLNECGRRVIPGSLS